MHRRSRTARRGRGAGQNQPEPNSSKLSPCDPVSTADGASAPDKNISGACDPSVPGPSVSDPSVSGPSVPDPSVSDPWVLGLSVPGPLVSDPLVLDLSVPGPSVSDPSVPGPPVSGPSVPGPPVFDPSVPGPPVFDPSVPGPLVSGPSVPGPSVFDPSVPGPSVFDPSVSGPSVPGPSIPGPSVFDPLVLDLSVPGPFIPRPLVPGPLVPGPSVSDPLVLDLSVPGPWVSDPSGLDFSVPGPSVPDPSILDLSLPNPLLPRPSFPDPSLPDPSLPGPSHLDLLVPIPSHLDPSLPPPSHLYLSVPGPSHLDPSLPGPSHLYLSVPRPSHLGPSHLYLSVPGPSHLDPSLAGPSYLYLSVPGPSHLDPSLPGLSHLYLSVHGPLHQDPLLPGPLHQDPSLPGPSHQDTQLPGPSHQDPSVSYLPQMVRKRLTARKQLPKPTDPNEADEQNVVSGSLKRRREEEDSSEESSDSETPVKRVPRTNRRCVRHSRRRREDEEDSSDEDSRGCLNPSYYNPIMKFYHPVLHSCWKSGQKVPYMAVVRTFDMIKKCAHQIKKAEILSNLLRSVLTLSPQDLLPVLYLSLNAVGPDQEGLKFGIGIQTFLKVLSLATEVPLQTLQNQASDMNNDLELMAEMNCKATRTAVRPPRLSASRVFAQLREISQLYSSPTRRTELMKNLLAACRHSEAQYITQHLLGELNLQMPEETVLAALAITVSLTRPGRGESPPTTLDAGRGMTPEARIVWLQARVNLLKQVFCEVPNLNRLVPAIMDHGLENLRNQCVAAPGTCLKLMGNSPICNISYFLRKYEKATFASGYRNKGVAVQIHYLGNDNVMIFNTGLEEYTPVFPEIRQRLDRIICRSVTNFILDVELMAWDSETRQFLDYEALLGQRDKVELCMYVFDLLYLNGECLIRYSLAHRRQLIRRNFVQIEGELVFPVSLGTKEEKLLSQFLDETLKESTEGLRIRRLDAGPTSPDFYMTARWQRVSLANKCHRLTGKLRQEYLHQLGNNMNLVVIGATRGRRRRSRRYLGFVLATYNKEKQRLQAVCRLLVGIGFKEEKLAPYYPRLWALTLRRPHASVEVRQSLPVECWFEPRLVLEVECEDLSLSAKYSAASGLVERRKGIFLRFPEFIKVKPDMRPEEATTSEEVALRYWQQVQNLNLKDE